MELGKSGLGGNATMDNLYEGAAGLGERRDVDGTGLAPRPACHGAEALLLGLVLPDDAVCTEVRMARSPISRAAATEWGCMATFSRG